MSLKENVNMAREKKIPQVLHDIKNCLEAFDLLGLHLIDHPVAGLASEFAEFHTVIEGAIAQNDEWHAKKYAPTLGDKP